MTAAPDKVALCIGINYTGAAPAIPALRFAENDAQALATLLQTRGFQVTTLLGAQASRHAIYAELNRLADLPTRLSLLYLPAMACIAPKCSIKTASISCPMTSIPRTPCWGCR